MGRRRGDIDRSLKAPRPHVKRDGRPRKTDKGSLSEMRRCPRHGLSDYHRYRAGKRDGVQRYRWICKRCLGEAVTRRKQKLKRMLVDEAGAVAPSVVMTAASSTFTSTMSIPPRSSSR